MANLFVGNLPDSISPTELRALFMPFGTVRNVKLVTDFVTGHFKRFGFVDLESDTDDLTVALLYNRMHPDRQLVIDLAHPSWCLKRGWDDPGRAPSDSASQRPGGDSVAVDQTLPNGAPHKSKAA